MQARDRELEEREEDRGEHQDHAAEGGGERAVDGAGRLVISTVPQRWQRRRPPTRHGTSRCSMSQVGQARSSGRAAGWGMRVM